MSELPAETGPALTPDETTMGGNGRVLRPNQVSAFIARQNPYLLAALIICLAYHATLSFYTYTRTYDAFVHIFLATITPAPGLIPGTLAGTPALLSQATRPAPSKPSPCSPNWSGWDTPSSSLKPSPC